MQDQTLSGEKSSTFQCRVNRCYRTFGPEHLQTGFAAGKYGKASLQLDDLESAEWGLTKADEILAKNFPSNHQSRSVFLAPLVEAYERMGRADDAKAVRDRLQNEMIGQYFYWSPDQRPTVYLDGSSL